MVCRMIPGCSCLLLAAPGRSCNVLLSAKAVKHLSLTSSIFRSDRTSSAAVGHWLWQWNMVGNIFRGGKTFYVAVKHLLRQSNILRGGETSFLAVGR